MKRVVSMVLAVAILVGMLPTTAWAAGDALSAGCCEHHQTHDDSCGYKAAAEGSDCTHQHTADCYEKETCIHTHGEECSVTCSHVCSTDNGCITMQQECVHLVHDAACGGLDEENPVCNHICEVVVDSEGSCYALLCSHAEPDMHDDACGYVEAEAEKACEYICEECAMEEADATAVVEVKALIDAIPALDVVQEMSQDEQKSVYEQTQAAYDAYEELTKDQKSQISDADSFFEALFSFFNRMISEVNTDSAFGGECGENLTWLFDNVGTLTISGSGSMTEYSSDSEAPWYEYSEIITELIIDNDVTSLSRYGFRYFEKLEKIYFNATAMNDLAYSGIFYRTGSDSPSVTVIIGANVTRIPSNLFSNGNYSPDWDASWNCNGVTSVIFEEGSMCESVGNNAFSYCYSLRSITIPESVTSIGNYAFFNCQNLLIQIEASALPKLLGSYWDHGAAICMNAVKYGVTDYGQEYWITDDNTAHVWKYHGDDKTVIIPETIEGVPVVEIATSAFATIIRPHLDPNGQITYVEIPDTVVTINSFAFDSCVGLEKIIIPKNVEYIGENAFYYCKNVTEIQFDAIAMDNLESDSDIFSRAGESVDGINVTIGSNVTRIPDYLFYDSNSDDAPNVTDVVFEEGSICESIGISAFHHCSTLSQVILPESISIIDKNAFCNCRGLKELTIPENAKTLGEYAFYGCTGLSTINFNAIDMDDVSSYTGYPYAFGNAGSENGSTVVFIGEKVKHIPKNLFKSSTSDCARITKVVFSENSQCESIESDAFCGCAYLNSIIIPSSVTKMGDGVFEECTNLTTAGPYDSGSNIEFGWMEEIPAWAFSSSCLTQIVFPDNIKRIGEAAFQLCRSLSSIDIPTTVTSIGDYAFNACETAKYITIPSSVSNIGEAAFMQCKSVTSVVIPDSVKTIGSEAFRACSNLESVRISNSITEISEFLFYYCTSLLSVNIPYGVTSIGSHSFDNCKSLISVYIPSSVRSIGYDIISNCPALTDVYYGGTEEEWKEISIMDELLRGDEDGPFVTVHYTSGSGGNGGGSGNDSDDDSETEIVRADVKFLREWDNVNEIAFWGKDPPIVEGLDLGSQVTEETDRSFIANVNEMLGTYVLAATKSREDGMIAANILLSIKPVETKTGIVTAFDGTTITIDGVIYTVPDDLGILFIDEGDTVIYHIYEGELIGINGDGSAEIEINKNSGEDSDSGNSDEDTSSSLTKCVYYSGWDPDSKTVTFGRDILFMATISDDADTSLVDSLNRLQGNYVLVEINEQDDVDELISVLPVESIAAKVEYVSSIFAKITISGTEYPVSSDNLVSNVHVGDYVLCHIYDGEVIAIEILQEHTGKLMGWNSDTREVSITLDNEPDLGALGYSLSKLADAESVEFLNKLSSGSTTIVTDVQLIADKQGFVYRAFEPRPVIDETPPYQGEEEPSDPETDEDKAISILISYRDDWEEAYNAFIESVNSTLLSFAGSDEEKREAVISKEANRMRNHDKSSSSKYISGDIQGYEEQAYNALARFFYDYATCEIPNLSSVDSSGTMAGVTIINRIMQNMKGESKDYKFGHITVSITAVIVFTSKFGNMTITDTENKNSIHLTVCSTQQECKDTLNVYVEELRDLATNSVYNVATAVYKDILGKSLSSLTSEYMTKTVTNLERKLGVVLSEKFQKAGVGQNLINTIDECYTFYTWVNKGINTGKNTDIEAAVNNIINLKFEDTTVPKGITKEAMKALKKAANKMNRAFNEYLEGTILQKEQSFFRYLFNCPVEVSVYNSAGEQIGFVGEEDIWYTDAIVINEIGGAKEILSLCDDKLSFDVTATDYGTMSCCFEEFNDNSVPIGRLNYYDILLEPEKTFEITVPDNLAVQVETLAITSGSQKTYPDEYISVTANGYITINCNTVAEDGTTGGLVRGSGAHVRGDAVVLYAEAHEGFEFIGWFEGEHLVCVNKLYEFTAKEDRNLTAKFFKNDFVYVDLDSAVGGTVIGEGRYHAGEIATIIAAPHDGYSFGGWYDGNELVSSNMEYSFEITTDVSFVAKFEEQPEHVHKYTAVIAAPSCTEKGYTTHTCSCGDSYMDSYKDATGHTVGKYSSDKESHWQVCTVCKEKMNVETHSGGTAICTKKAACSICGTSYGELASHDYESSWSQGDTNGHWHECKNCSAHDTQVKHTPGAAATEDTAQFCTVCGYVITPALGHTCTTGTKWYSNGTYHWHLCTSCGAWVKTSYHSYSSDTDEICNVCGYTRTVTATKPTEETEVAMTETIETSVSDEEVIATDTVPMIVPTETNENLSDNAVSEDTDSHGVSGVLITVFAIVALGSLAALVILLAYKKRRESE